EFPFAWIVAAGNFLGELVDIVGRALVHVFVIGARHRMQLDDGVAVLTLAAGLLDVSAFGFSLLANRFAISDLRTANIGLHAVFTKHAVDNDFKVKFAHTGNQSLAGVWLGGNTEGRIFLSETLQRDAELVLVGLGFRLDRDRNNR